MVDLEYIGDIKLAVLSAAGFVHDLRVHVTRRRHDDDNVFPFFVEKEGSVADFGAREEKVVHRAQGIH